MKFDSAFTVKRAMVLSLSPGDFIDAGLIIGPPDYHVSTRKQQNKLRNKSSFATKQR
jgi:hypothetical protein